MVHRTVILDDPRQLIEIVHDDSDQTTWRVVCSKRFLGLKRKTASYLFIDRDQAKEFAEELKSRTQGHGNRPP